MAAAEPQPLSLTSRDGRLRIEFVWNRDRFTHSLFVNDASVGQSVDDEADSAWPPSPPIQQLSHELIDGREVILGVGAAGRSHWSISVQSCRTRPAAIEIELACRCHDTPRFLGSTYRIQGAIELIAIDGLAEHDDCRAMIRATGGDSATHRWSYLLEPAP